MKTLNIKTILVPIDFSETSIQAINPAHKLAQRFGARVHLVHVENLVFAAGFESPMPIAVSAVDAVALQRDHASRLKKLRSLATREHLWPGDCHLLSDMPAFESICRLARDIDADLIVMPTHGRTGLKHVVLGSTAERIVQHSPCPVFICRNRAAAIDKILVPVDFSDCSLEALKEAAAFAKRVAAKLVILHVVYLDLAFTADGYAMYDMSAAINRAKQVAEKKMRSFVRRVAFGGVKFKTRVEVGAPISQVCNFAEKEDVDLIITSTHGRTGLKHVVLGSVAEQIVRYASRPVLVVPSHPAERAKVLSRIARGASGLAERRIQTEAEKFTKRFRKLEKHPFPERRKTNKFRESHQLLKA